LRHHTLGRRTEVGCKLRRSGGSESYKDSAPHTRLRQGHRRKTGDSRVSRDYNNEAQQRSTPSRLGQGAYILVEEASPLRAVEKVQKNGAEVVARELSQSGAEPLGNAGGGQSQQRADRRLIPGGGCADTSPRPRVGSTAVAVGGCAKARGGVVSTSVRRRGSSPADVVESVDVAGVRLTSSGRSMWQESG
jgi:hypothetical protein